MPDPEYQSVLPLLELKRGAMRAVKLGVREIVLCHTRAGVFALDNICTHARTRMSEGELRRDKLICPLHGAAFDVQTGQVVAGPAVLSLVTYPVRVTNGQIEVQLPAAPASSR